jgi:uncharacterized protein YbbC (DUF1343 family)
MFVKLKILLVFLSYFAINCSHSTEIPVNVSNNASNIIEPVIEVGALQMDQYVERLQASRGVALVVNPTSMVNKTHLVDTLLQLGVPIKKILAPEHGFRGQADAGETIKDGIDRPSGLPLVSLYGKNKKPTTSSLKDIDWVVFDIQDVGARFYTYISTMHYIMEACAENEVSFMVLDRPNPNGHFVDGPVLKESFKSFVGMHPVPVVHGLTVGEYAKMIVGEGWINQANSLELAIIPCQNYSHKSLYELPVPPSPNLPNMRSIYLYPSLCLFEGTVVSVGRGTDKQFQLYGHPKSSFGNTTFTPISRVGAKYPKHEGVECRGVSMLSVEAGEIAQAATFDLSYLLTFYQHFEDQSNFFLENKFFDKLAGTDVLRNQIKAGIPLEEIRESWQEELLAYKNIRKKYLLYADFE